MLMIFNYNNDTIRRESFEKLYNQYAVHALRLAYAILRDQSSAEDAVQEAFIRVYYNRQKFDESRSFKPWFDRILVNECKRILSKKKQFVDIEEAQKTEDLSRADECSDEIQLLKSAISRLNTKHREIILLKYMQGYTEAEIAQILSIPRSTVKSRLFEARNKLKTMMMEDE